jgi:ferric-dicitrate binding protein FerR (iron transport regulator)
VGNRLSSLVNARHTRYKTGLLLLISGGAIACAGAALKVDFRQVVHGLLHVVGIRAGHASAQHPQEVIVAAGNELTIDGGVQRLTPLAPDEVARRLAWAGMYDNGGWLNFRGQSLEIVVAEFNRHNKRKLRVGDPQTGRLQIGGSFQDDDLDGFVAALAMTHGVRATLSGPDGRFGDEIILNGGNAAGSAAISGTPDP